MIISGAFGLFKKDVVIAAGGYDRETLGEDMELVVRLHVFFRLFLDVVRVTAFIGYKKRKKQWGNIKRVKQGGV